MVYLDDILTTGPTEAEHLATLEEVFRRLHEAGLRSKKEKCVFMAPSVVYLRHKIDAEGLHPVPEKVKVIQEAPTPKNVSELKSYLGLLSYYSKFLPNSSTVLSPYIYFYWRAYQKAAFEESKQLLLSSQVLLHFDPCSVICLACDTSAYGIGAVLSHKIPDGTENHSRTLSEAEKKYSQIALACVVGVTRFHSYYGDTISPYRQTTKHYSPS